MIKILVSITIISTFLIGLLLGYKSQSSQDVDNSLTKYFRRGLGLKIRPNEIKSYVANMLMGIAVSLAIILATGKTEPMAYILAYVILGYSHYKYLLSVKSSMKPLDIIFSDTTWITITIMLIFGTFVLFSKVLM